MVRRSAALQPASGQMLFGQHHELPAESAALQRRPQGQQSDISAVAAYFRVNTPGKSIAIFQNQELAGCKERLQSLLVDTVAFDGNLLRKESGVNERDERAGVRGLAEAFAKTRNLRGGRHVSDSGENG